MVFFERVYLTFYQRTGGGTFLAGLFLVIQGYNGWIDAWSFPIALAIAIGVDGVATGVRSRRDRAARSDRTRRRNERDQVSH